MNFLKLYVGDYQRDTGHLSITEHGAYLLMLQHYYATEKPLPTGKALYRLLRSESKEDREAIDSVTRQFWHETETGLVNGRASEEIEKADHQRTVNREIGNRGGRPRKTDPVIERKTDSVNGSETDSVSHEEPINNPNQTPDTRHQKEPKASPPPAARARKTALPEGFAASDGVRSWYASKGFVESLEAHVDRFRETCRARGYAYADWDAALRRAISDDWARLRQGQQSLQSGEGWRNSAV